MNKMKIFVATFLIFALHWNIIIADIPVNCTVEDVTGEWVFYEGPIHNDSNIDCPSVPVIHRKIRVRLEDFHVYQNGFSEGIWTMIYNQGFDVLMGYRTYFAFFKFKEDKHTKLVTSLCNETFIGKSHDITLRHWACFFARKKGSFVAKSHSTPFPGSSLLKSVTPSDKDHKAIVDAVNKKQTSWRAEIHHNFLGKSTYYLLNLRGGKRSWLPYNVRAAAVSNSSFALDHEMQESLDWRNIGSVNYVSPVRNQGHCGSCYAFSSVGMIESRLRVATKNNLQPILSPQDIVSCTTLSQGCEGGFPYLIAGKYGWEVGLVEESCNPYNGKDTQCPVDHCHRYYTASYGYVGGFYGACTEELMKNALRHGPLSVSFEVYPDFMHYKTGIYHYTGVKGLEPFITVNHAVLLVGYGVNKTTREKYWIVKNSWGNDWGEEGYFRIRRGVDECGIESCAVEAFPMPY